jgi:predicted ATPase
MKDQYIISAELIEDKKRDNENYPFSLSIVRLLGDIRFAKDVTFLVGENGTGKSTLLEAIAVQSGFNPEGGTKNFNFETRATHSDLGNSIRISKGLKKMRDGFFFRAETFYNLASNIDEIGVINSYGGKSLHEQSHGESFLSLFLNRMNGNGLYLLDEPEAALSPQRQLAFVARMRELVEKDSQFIIVTHSPIILSYPKAKIIQISEDEVREIPYKETECYNFYKDFIDNHERILRELFK